MSSLIPTIPSSDYQQHFSPFISTYNEPTIVNDLTLLSIQECPANQIQDWSLLPDITLPGKYTINCFDEDEKALLTSTYRKMYPLSKNVRLLNEMISSYKQFTKVCIGNENLSSKLVSRDSKRTLCIANRLDDSQLPCEIKCFIQHQVVLNNKPVNHIFAVVSWLEKVENYDYLEPITVWNAGGYEPPNEYMYTPVQRLFSRCSYCVKDGQVILTPFERKVYC